MNKFFLLIILGSHAIGISAQVPTQSLGGQSKNLLNSKTTVSGKSLIDFNAIDNWSQVGTGYNDVSINSDGKYFAYVIQRNDHEKKTLVLQSTSNDWKNEFIGIEPGFFSSNGKQYIFQKRDSLCFLSLADKSILYIKNILSFKNLIKDQSHWLAYQLKGDEKTLVLRNLLTGKEQSFNGIASYSFHYSGKWLTLNHATGDKELVLYNLITGKEHAFRDVADFLISKGGDGMLFKSGQKDSLALHKVSFPDVDPVTIWTPDRNLSLGDYASDELGDQVVFNVQRKSETGQLENAIWYYRTGMAKSIEKVNNHSTGLDQGLIIEGTPEFTSDGRYIIFSLKAPADERKPISNGVPLDVWNYKDTVIQSKQLLGIDDPTATPYPIRTKAYPAVVSIDGEKVIRLATDTTRMLSIQKDFATVKRDVHGDRFWEYGNLDSVWLVSLADGHRVFLKKSDQGFEGTSPRNRYIVYFDEEVGHYFSFELATGKRVNISAEVPVYLGTEIECDPAGSLNNDRTGTAGWLENGAGILIYDSYDLWQLDLSGNKKPINVTNGFGRKNGIKLRLTGGIWNNGFSIDGIVRPIFKENSSFLLTAFDKQTRYNGFFRLDLSKKGDPDLLCMGPYVMELGNNLLLNNGDAPSGQMSPLKARNASVWIVRRQTATDAPNYFVTTDFRYFKRLTDLQPQKSYSWLTTELISFKQLDGTISQGLLYKPENFDSTQKYPVLINYYYQFSHRLFEYPQPFRMSNAFLNIPWFVSRGYLIFVPDIHFTKNRPRPASSLNTVEGAAQYLEKLSYVDAGKMAISGHSRAGGFTNYILTHSVRFAAVLEGAGVSDWVSAQLQLSPDNGEARLIDVQQEPFFWESMEMMKESPIMNVKSITSPLLIFHNKLDAAVPWEQAVELFISMRRLNKRVWMLQYDKGRHSVGGKSGEDFAIRATQFFDHYLKGAPAPVWMTRGIRASLKGIETGLELDTDGACGKDCKICKKLNSKTNALNKPNP